MDSVNTNEVVIENDEIETEESFKRQSDDSMERNLKLMSPMQMVMRRFFRSKLSVIGLIMIVSLFLFCWVGPIVYTKWEASQIDETVTTVYAKSEIEYIDENGETVTFYQIIETDSRINVLAQPSSSHVLGTDETGRDVLARIMYGGRVSLTISFLAVFVVTILLAKHLLAPSGDFVTIGGDDIQDAGNGSQSDDDFDDHTESLHSNSSRLFCF